MARRKIVSLVILGIAAGLGLAWQLQRQRRETPGLHGWRKVLARRHGLAEAQQLAAAVRQQHTAMVAETPPPANRALRWHLKDKILPGLALYRVLLQTYGGDHQAALAEVDEAFRSAVLAKSRLVTAPLKALPDPFPLFKIAFGRVMAGFPPKGWDIAYIENSQDQISFNITRCFYLNTLTALGAPELTASFCKTDEVMGECFPSSIRFVRLHTLGRGDEVCDFRYCRVDKF
jgi:hypothetical protein